MPGRHGKQRQKRKKSRRERPTEMENILKDSIHNRTRHERSILKSLISPVLQRLARKVTLSSCNDGSTLSSVMLVSDRGMCSREAISDTAASMVPSFLSVVCSDAKESIKNNNNSINTNNNNKESLLGSQCTVKSLPLDAGDAVGNESHGIHNNNNVTAVTAPVSPVSSTVVNRVQQPNNNKNKHMLVQDTARQIAKGARKAGTTAEKTIRSTIPKTLKRDGVIQGDTTNKITTTTSRITRVNTLLTDQSTITADKYKLHIPRAKNVTQGVNLEKIKKEEKKNNVIKWK